MSSNLSIHQRGEYSPVITCLMSVYNGQEFLKEAIDSVLAQTYPHFELLIINDASTDDTVQIIQSYDDPRIRLVHNRHNLGLTKSLNKGIELARGRYIARLDADDWCFPTRFEKQLKVLLEKEVVMVCDKPKYVFGDASVDSPEKVGVELFFHNCITHSSALFKKQIGGQLVRYNEAVLYAQDYALWCESHFRNSIWPIQEDLVGFRVHDHQLTKSKSSYQIETVNKVFRKWSQEIGFSLTSKQLQIHQRVNGPSPGYSAYFFEEVIDYFGSLIEFNEKAKVFDSVALNKRIISYLEKYFIEAEIGFKLELKVILFITKLNKKLCLF